MKFPLRERTWHSHAIEDADKHLVATAASIHDKNELIRRANAFDELLESLGWITEFCAEHPEWFGEGNPADGSEYEWLDSAQALVAKYAAPSTEHNT